MNLSEFIALDENEKKNTVLHLGVLLAKRMCDQSMIFLFQLNGYYVETYFDSGSKAIKEFRMGHGSHILDPYLPGIPINNLLDS